MSRNVNMARSFKPKDAFGQPRAILNNMEKDSNGLVIDGQRHVMGYIYGKADLVDTKLINKPDGSVEEYPLIKGAFEAVPTDPNMPITRTRVAFFPENVHDEIAAQLEAADGGSIQFAFEVVIVSKQKIAAGFQWEYGSKSQMQTHDEFAELRTLALAGTGMNASNLLAPPANADAEETETVEDSAAPAPAKGKGKK